MALNRIFVEPMTGIEPAYSFGKLILGSNRHSAPPAQRPYRLTRIPATSAVLVRLRTDTVRRMYGSGSGAVGGTGGVRSPQPGTPPLAANAKHGRSEPVLSGPGHRLEA
jgi:hypothetical protein